MTRLACGLRSEEEVETGKKSAAAANKAKTAAAQQYTVAQSGRKFAVRRLDAKMQNIELGRYVPPPLGTVPWRF